SWRMLLCESGEGLLQAAYLLLQQRPGPARPCQVSVVSQSLHPRRRLEDGARSKVRDRPLQRVSRALDGRGVPRLERLLEVPHEARGALEEQIHDFRKEPGVTVQPGHQRVLID